MVKKRANYSIFAQGCLPACRVLYCAIAPQHFVWAGRFQYFAAYGAVLRFSGMELADVFSGTEAGSGVGVEAICTGFSCINFDSI